MRWGDQGVAFSFLLNIPRLRLEALSSGLGTSNFFLGVSSFRLGVPSSRMKASSFFLERWSYYLGVSSFFLHAPSSEVQR